MAQVAILINGSPTPRKTQLSATLATVLGCPVLTPAKVQEVLVQQVGPVAPRAGVLKVADEATWRTAGLVEAGIVIDAEWGQGDRTAVEAGLELAGSPRLVEVWCVGATEPLGLTPVVHVDTSGEVDMDALVVEISALFV
ncbi:MAG: hypothetical protein JWP75_1196 [Frondihabitans sp.]|nr:hypothetical protein [Frondihabitans sp.]